MEFKSLSNFRELVLAEANAKKDYSLLKKDFRNWHR